MVITLGSRNFKVRKNCINSRQIFMFVDWSDTMTKRMPRSRGKTT